MKEKAVKRKAIIFDLDGTLLDTLTDLTDSVNFALETLKESGRSLEEVRAFLGDGYAALMERAVTNKELSAKALEIFNGYYSAHFEDSTKPYEGVAEALSALYRAGMRMAVVSNKGDVEVKRLCEKFFYPYIKVSIGVREGIPKKPAPDMLFTAMNELEVTPRECVMVGDGEPDVVMSKAAGLDVVSVLWGFRSLEQLSRAGAKRFLRSPAELVSLLE